MRDLPVRPIPPVFRLVAAGAEAKIKADRTPEKVKYHKTKPPDHNAIPL
jgi:hypothetical protein